MKHLEVILYDKDLSPEGLTGLIKKLEKAAESRPALILLNMSSVTHINSGAIGVIIRKHKDLQLDNGSIAVTGLKENISRICENSGLFKIVSNHTE
ncbi:MAG: STAS domain-containing protein [Fibrobacteres bacterium]|nr:STAS domain-containing protein [Fibrobacterota bacterium]